MGDTCPDESLCDGGDGEPGRRGVPEEACQARTRREETQEMGPAADEGAASLRAPAGTLRGPAEH